MSTPEPKEVVRRLAIAAADAAYGYRGGASEYSVARVEHVLDGLGELIAAGQAMREAHGMYNGGWPGCSKCERVKAWDAAYAKLCAGGKG